MKKFFMLQIIESFIVGALTIVLPLLMEQKNISIVDIGIIFAIQPIVFQLVRLTFSILSEFYGRKVFFILNSFVTVLSNAVYYLAYSPVGYAFGKITEAIKDGTFWAVNRPYVMDHSEEKKKRLVQLRIFSSSSEAIGNLAAGFLIVWLFYQNTILFIVFVALLAIPISLSLKDLPRSKFSLAKACRSLDFRNRTIEFKKFLILFLISGLSDGFIAGYVITIFLNNMGMNVELIGIILAVKLLITGMSTYIFTKIKITRLLLIGGLLYCASILLLGFSNVIFAIAVLILLGIANGFIVNASEGFFSSVTSSESYASDIGLLMTSFHTGRTASLFASGFVIASFGFPAVFILSSLTYAIYTFFTYKVVKKKAFLYK